MCVFGPAGAETIVIVTFGGLPPSRRIGGQQRAGSGRVWFFSAFISIIERIVVLLGKNWYRADNLNNNNIYKKNSIQ